jgi:transposase InsO family protein
MVALVVGLTVQAFSRWLRKQLTPEENTTKLGRPEAMAPEVVQAFQQQYVASYKTWGTHVLREWGIRQDLGTYGTDTIARAIKPLLDHPPEKVKPQRYDITAPDVMWSEDGTGFKQQGCKQELLVLQDECSRFKLNRRLVDGPADSNDVHAYLKEAFEKYGAPLVLKRDGQSIFQEKNVQELLEQYGVVSLVGPAYYPKYNGKKERSMRDVKTFERAIRRHGPKGTLLIQRIDAGLYDLNELRPRPILRGKTAREVYDNTPRPVVDRAEFRKEVDLRESQLKAAARSRKERDSARRRAIEQVLLSYGLLAKREDVSTNFTTQKRKN